MTSHRIHMLLDRSGSMEAWRRQTIDAVNGYLASLRADALARDTSFTLSTFDSEGIDVVRRDEPGDRVRDLQAHEFQPRSATPLYDAIGHVVEAERLVRVPGRRAIVVVTDGEENGSRRMRPEALREQVLRHESQGWIFIFLGANQNAAVEAAKFGVPERRAINYRASSGPSAAAAFAAAAAVSFAFFMLKPGETAAASAVGFSETDRQAAFDGAADWKAEVEKDIAGAPTEPDVPSTWSGPGLPGSGSGGGTSTSAEAGDVADDAAEGAEEGSILDTITETISDAIGSLFSGFLGDGDDGGDGGGGDSGGDGGGGD